MGRDVFVSYRHEDQAVANRICTALERRHVDCWIAPRDMPPGEDWPIGIVDGIEQCHTFVLILSENCQHSRQIARELELADSHALRIVALRVQDVQPPPQLLFFLGNVQWLDAFGDRFDASMARLAEAMNRSSDSYPAPLTRIDPRVHELISSGVAKNKSATKRGRMLAKIVAGILLAAGIGTSAYLKARHVEAGDRYQQGEKLFRSGDLKQALREYSAAIDADGDFYNAYCERARVYQAAGDRRSARADLRTAIALYPQRPFARKLLDELLPLSALRVALKDQASIRSAESKAVR
jgi:tetratricopeptide (TPR) repeat protein